MHFTPYFLLFATALAAPIAVDYDDDICENDAAESEVAATPVRPTPLPSSAFSSFPMAAIVFTPAPSSQDSQPTPVVTPSAIRSETVAIPASSSQDSQSNPIVTPSATQSETVSTPAADESSSVSSTEPETSATPTPSTPAGPGSSKYTRMVAFGDNLSDNGNGKNHNRYLIFKD